ncbi:MAG: pectinesterase family protein [Dysgonomonas sp.]
MSIIIKYVFAFLFAISVSISAYSTAKWDIIVDQNTVDEGSFATIQEAINSVPDLHSGDPITIYIKKGVYKEKLVLPTNKHNIKLIGEDVDSTFISYNDYAASNPTERNAFPQTPNAHLLG